MANTPQQTPTVGTGPVEQFDAIVIGFRAQNHCKDEHEYVPSRGEEERGTKK